MSKAKKAELTLLKAPQTADDIDALFRALTGSQEPMTEDERKQVEAILAEPPPSDPVGAAVFERTHGIGAVEICRGGRSAFTSRGQCASEDYVKNVPEPD
jgi:hypothetical protein